MFEKLDAYRQAAQCYYTAKKYKKAAELFIKNEMYSQAAECYMITCDYEKAAKMFEESNLILKALECYENLQNWEEILLCLNRNKGQFKEIERESLINKYVPIALNSIFRMLNMGDNEENKGKALEDKYISKAPAILEESDVDSEDSEEEKEDKGEPIQQEDSKNRDESLEHDEENQQDQSETKEIAELQSNVEQQHVSDEEEEVIDTTTKNKLNDSSFSVISKAELEDNNFEHLSNFDPEDEFLNRNNSFSVIGSVLSNDKESISGYSEFSIISGSRADSIVKGNHVETDRDIYIEDIAMQKIIYYVSLFSEDTKNYLNKIRSRNQLSQTKDDLEADGFELELDNIDVELVKILLDVLENFDMFRLCMIVCNRYNITEYLSRYLTSVCFKYSNLKLLNHESIMQINNLSFRDRQQQVSVLANEAVHNMFSLVSQDMIRQVKTEDLSEQDAKARNECWRYLFYLGFWKKLIYVMDSMASLKLCFSIGDLTNFKIVYMIHYREYLTDDEIRQLSEDITGKWIDEKLSKDSELGVLCYKVMLEDLINNSDSDIEFKDPDMECNNLLNKWLRVKKGKDTNNDQVLRNCIELATTKLNNLMGKNSTNQIQIFDIFVFWSRVFAVKKINFVISRLMHPSDGNKDSDFEMLCSMFSACKTISSLVEEPMRYHSVFSVNEMNIVNQGLLLAFKVRVPEKSNLFIHILPFVLMHRNSIFYEKNIDSYLQVISGDRSNQELIECYKRESDFHISHILLVDSIKQHMGNLQKYGAGSCYDYLSCNIADLEANYIRISQLECLQWFKKSVLQYLSSTVLRGDPKFLFICSINQGKMDMFHEAVYTDEIFRDCFVAFSTFSLHNSIVKGGKFIRFSTETLSRMQENYHTASNILNKLSMPSNYSKNSNLVLTNNDLLIDKRSLTQSQAMIRGCISELKYFGDFQTCQIESVPLVYNEMMTKGISYFIENFADSDQDKETVIRRFSNACHILAKFGQSNIVEFYINKTIEFYGNSNKVALENFRNLIEGIEKHQCGLWAESALSLNKFINVGIDHYDLRYLIKDLERSWYRTIVNYCGYEEGAFIPINVLNYVHEHANIPHDMESDPYCQMLFFTREVDIQDLSEKDFLEIITKILKTCEKVFKALEDDQIYHLKTFLRCVFNMIGTLAANFTNYSFSMFNNIEKVINIFGESDYIEKENIDKLYEYFGTKEAISAFRYDFLEITDEEKNDTLYLDVREGAHNQFLVHLQLIRKSEDSNTEVVKKYKEFMDKKKSKMIAFKFLTKRLSKYVKNYKLFRKTIKGEDSQALSGNNLLWLTGNNYNDLYDTSKIITQNDDFKKILSDVDSTMLVLYNIFNSHYTIKNSFDTHFIVYCISTLNNASQSAREQLAQKIIEFKQEENKNDESFNPFIEIDENVEENKFVDLQEQEHMVEYELIFDSLKDVEENIRTDIINWLSKKSSPELLNLQTQQHTLKQKLKWEKMMNSKEKLFQIKKAFRKIRKR